MYGITFDGEKHTYDDFGLCCTSVDIGLPTVKKKQINLKGADGVLDLTDAFGRTLYGNRKLTFRFDHEDRNYTEWMIRAAEVVNYLHGKRKKVVLDNDPNYYYDGRISCKITKNNKIYSQIIIEIDAAPYKRDLRDAAEYCWNWDKFSFIDGVIREYYNIPVNGEYALLIIGSEMPVTPVLNVSAPMTVSKDGRTYHLVAGENHPYGLVIYDGENTLEFEGNGIVSVSYRGGRI